MLAALLLLLCFPTLLCTLVLTFFYTRFKEGEGTVRQARVKQNYGMIFSLKQDMHSNSVRITYFPTHILVCTIFWYTV